MLTLPYRNLLVQTVPLVLPNWLDCKNLVNAVRAGSWDATVLIPFTYANAVPLLVDAADGQGWLRDLVQRLATTFPARLEFVTVLTEFDRAATPRTVLNPFDEVLLDGDRPFVNRQPLRTHLLNLTNPAGAAVLLVDGQPQTGKSFSFYLINHVAPTKGFVVHKFKMTSLPKPDELALDILYRLGVDRAIPPIGQESAERWAEKLAGVVARAIDEKKTLRLFVFDQFSETPLPEGTASLITRLATYADEELRPFLRVVLVRFPGALAPELDDVTPRDAAEPFTTAHMVAVVMQVAAARNWSVTQAVVKAKIDEYHQVAGRSLKDRFKFLRELLQQLAAAP
jgi:hypothetical protein